ARGPSELIPKAAMVFECIFTAKRKLPSGLIVISLSSSRSRLAGVGFGSYTPVPRVRNGEPLTAPNRPVPSFLNARMEFLLATQVGHSPVLVITYTRFNCAKQEPRKQRTNSAMVIGVLSRDETPPR